MPVTFLFIPDEEVGSPSTRALIETGAVDLSGLLSDIRPAGEAAKAYPAALLDSDCLKMALDWRTPQ